MKKVFLDELPRGGKCVNKNSINWKESIGYKVKFVYYNIEGEIEIVDYVSKGQKLTIKYKDKTKPIKTNDFLRCKLGNILGVMTNDFKVEIGTNFKDEKRDITIIDREVRYDNSGHRWKYYKYHCNKDGNEDWILESFLLNGRGCKVCSNHKYMLGVNTIWDKARWMVKLGVSEKDAKTHTVGCGDEIDIICPYCKKHKKCIIYDIYNNKSISCNCGDGISYPNKYKYEFYNQLLEQGQIKNFETEYKIEDKKYDIFVTLNNGETLIDETHGVQHGEFIYCGDLLLVKETKGFGKRDEIKNDIYKCKLAYKNGIDNYIQLDCTLSDPEYIKHSIENSWLSKIFDLSNIDWNKCDEYALKNIVKEVCNYWHEHREVNKEYITTKYLCNIFNLSMSSINKYLKKEKN